MEDKVKQRRKIGVRLECSRKTSLPLQAWSTKILMHYPLCSTSGSDISKQWRLWKLLVETGGARTSKDLTYLITTGSELQDNQEDWFLDCMWAKTNIYCFTKLQSWGVSICNMSQNYLNSTVENLGFVLSVISMCQQISSRDSDVILFMFSNYHSVCCLENGLWRTKGKKPVKSSIIKSWRWLGLRWWS